MLDIDCLPGMYPTYLKYIWFNPDRRPLMLVYDYFDKQLVIPSVSSLQVRVAVFNSIYRKDLYVMR